MEYAREEILSGVYLTHIRSDKFKSACLSVNLLTQLDRESAAMNALLPQVLRRIEGQVRGTCLCAAA